MKTISERGFTLLEILIVIAIIGIMMAMATPSYQDFMGTRRLNGAARQVMSDLMLARQRSVSLNQKVKVALTSSYIYQIWNDADDNGTVAANEGENTQRNIQSLYHDVTLSRNVDPIFNPRGTASLGGTFTVTNAFGTKYVIIALTGTVRISDTPP